MTETLVVRELAVRELDPKSGNLGGADGTRLGRLRAIAADLEKIKMMTFDQIEQPQPTSDFEIAKIQRVVSETWLYLPRLIARTA